MSSRTRANGTASTWAALAYGTSSGGGVFHRRRVPNRTLLQGPSLAGQADGRCDLRSLVGHDGRGMAESLFHGTLERDGTVIEALGAEVFEFADERIKEIRDHHRILN
jgi:hypothetical protein